jgi:hypothetical protein
MVYLTALQAIIPHGNYNTCAGIPSRRCDLTSPPLFLVFSDSRYLLAAWAFYANSSRLLSDCITTSSLSLLLTLATYYWLLLTTVCFFLLSDKSQSQSYVTTDGQPVSLSWNKTPIWGLRSDLDCCLTVAGLLIWGALSDERMGLPFAIATGPR